MLRHYRNWIWLFMPACMVLTLTLWACSTSGRHEVLSFLFDGVPQLEEADGATAGTGPGGEKKEGKKMVGSYHQPWWEQKCESCHTGMRREKKNTVAGFFPGVPRLVLPLKQLCFKCHEPFQGKFTHGPAAVGACNVCHRPHQSHVAPFLLREKEPRKLCNFCHGVETFATMAKHVESGWDRCLVCHDPHASGRQHLLRKEQEEEADKPTSGKPAMKSEVQ